MSPPLKDSDPEKWKYAFHIYIKHTLFEKYFKAWSKILGKGFKNIGYLDGFAGRGEYTKPKKYGSPLLALDTLTKNENYFDSCLCVFVEKDCKNFEVLTKLLNNKKDGFSTKIAVEPHNREFTQVLPEYLIHMGERPFFVFLDPFGFKGLPLRVVKEILIRGQNEVFITLMTRDINRFLHSDVHQKALIDLLGGEEYLDGLNNQEDVANRYATRLLKYARHVIHYQVGADEKYENIYYLIHVSNHFMGFKIMKDIMFNHGKEGQFAYKGIRDLKSNTLLTYVDPNREIKHIKDFLLRLFNGRTIAYGKVLEESYSKTIYIEKHYREALRELENEGRIIINRKGVKSHRGGFKDNYLITFSPKQDLMNFFSRIKPVKKEGLELEKAVRVGSRIKDILEPICKKIRIAGSIRRKKPFVKDIELVCEPKGSTRSKLNRIIENLAQKKKIKILKNGERYKQFILLDKNQKELIKVDLFIVLPPAQWGVILLIRTGSAEFSKRFVSEIKPKFRVKDGHLEELCHIKDELGERDVYLPVKTLTERSVFKTVHWNYIKPAKRIR